MFNNRMADAETSAAAGFMCTVPDDVPSESDTETKQQCPC